MTKFNDKSFSVAPGASKKYRDNYDKIFQNKEKKYCAGCGHSIEGDGVLIPETKNWFHRVGCRTKFWHE